MYETTQTSRSPVSASGQNLSRFYRLLPAIYLVVALIVGGLYALISPPFWGPDEAGHALRGFQVSEGTLLGKKRPQGQGDYLNSGLAKSTSYFEEEVLQDIHRLNRERPVPRVLPEQIQQVQDLTWSDHTDFVTFPETRLYPPTFYVATAIAWKLAQASHLTILHSMLLARLSNLLVTTLLGWLALRWSGQYRFAICAVLLSPTLLAVDGSCSQDGLIVAAAALAVSLLSRAIAERRLARPWELLVTALALCACGMTRPPYALLLALLFLPAIELRPWNRKSLFLPAVFAVVGFLVDVSWSLAVKPLGVMVRAGADPAAQAAFLLHHPFQAFLRMTVSTIKGLPALSAEIASAASGNVRPSRILAGLVLVLVAALFVSSPATRLQNKASRALVLLVCLGITAAVTVAEYMIWSTPGSYQVQGVQFRHFLPLLLVLTLYGGLRRLNTKAWARPAVAGLALLNLVILAVDAHLFYSSGLLAALRAAYL